MLIIEIKNFIIKCIIGCKNFKKKFDRVLKYKINPKNSPIIMKNLNPEYVNMKKKIMVKIPIIMLNIMSVIKTTLWFLYLIFF